MRRIPFLPIAPAIVLAAIALWSAPAQAQDWSIHLDVPVDANFFLKQEGQVIEYTPESQEGGLLSVTTPFHLGFGYENYSMLIRPPGEDFSIRFRAELLDTYWEIPVTSWLVVTPGVSWGVGKLETDAGDTDTLIFEDMNLWGYLGVIAVRIPWGLQVRLGYHEVRGLFVQRDRGQTPIEVRSSEMKATLTTLGFGYTF